MAERGVGPYAPYDVLDKWSTPSFNDVTRGVLRERLYRVPERRFFTEAEFALLEALCARLVPQDDRETPVPIAPWIDADLAEGRGEGFRRPDTPPAAEAWRKGLAGIEAEARARRGHPFAALDAADQDALLHAVQSGEVDPQGFGGVDPAHFFTQVLLKAAAGVYYSHPDAWSEIGFGGPASPRGYVRMELDERDPWEAPLVPAPGDAP